MIHAIKKTVNRALWKIREGNRVGLEFSSRFSRAAALSSLRSVDPKIPTSWEFSGFSQNGEDGITTFLLSRLKEKNRYFIEIGASDGFENNTAWLAFGMRYSGLMVEGSEDQVRFAQKYLQPHNWGVRYSLLFVTKENVGKIKDQALFADPDVLSLDIDGNDYYILCELLDIGIRPKILIVEYNSAFGPEKAITIPYQADFSYQVAHGSQCYFGASIMAWHKLLQERDYAFVTVESNGVNAFFVDKNCFESDFINSLKGLRFSENFALGRMHGLGWKKHFSLIKDLSFKRL